MGDWVTSVMESLGYWGVGLLMFLENVFPPLPSEIIMPSAGFAVAQGELRLWVVIVVGSVGALLGQFPLYYLGHVLGEKGLHVFADRHGKWVTISGKDIDNASAWLRDRGPIAVSLCRLVPGIRSLISLPAGVAGMNLVVFTLYSAVGITLWTGVLATLGYVLGDHYELLERYIGPLGTVVWIGLGALLVGWIAWRLRGCYLHSQAPCPLRDDET